MQTTSHKCKVSLFDSTIAAKFEISIALSPGETLASGHPAPNISRMKALTTTAVAIAMEHAQAGAQVGREAVERDSVLRELWRLLQPRNRRPLHLVGSAPPAGAR
jgi:hypothetical protein